MGKLILISTSTPGFLRLRRWLRWLRWLRLALRHGFATPLLGDRGSAYPAYFCVFLLGHTELQVLDSIIGKLLYERLTLHFLLDFRGCLHDLLCCLEAQGKVDVLLHDGFDFEGDLDPRILFVGNFLLGSGVLIHYDGIG